MSEESDLEKTEPASQSRIDKAREDGDVPRSRELATFTVLIAATLGFWISGEAMVEQLKHMLSKSLSFERTQIMDPSQIGVGIIQQLVDLLLVFAPLAGLLMLAALFSPMLIGGWLFSAKALAPNFGKLNPMKGLANMLSIRALIELLKAIGKTLLVSFVAWAVITSQFDAIFALIAQSPIVSSVRQGHLLLVCFTSLVGALALIALIDAPYQMMHYAKKLMMTREDIRQESKESNGNPEIKAKIRAQQRAMARRRMMADVPTADVVVTNPTHYAIALKYPENANHAPLVIAKGMNEVATKIREIAMVHDIVLMEAPPLARALYQHAELGEEIPAQLYAAVAQVLAYVFQLRAWRTHGGPVPQFPEEVSVPPGMDTLATINDDSVNTIEPGVPS
jgi:flagellar biosynthetic protein FlhB